MATSEKQHAEVTQEIREAAHQLIHECLSSESLVVDTTARWLADYAAEVERKARLNEAKWWASKMPRTTLYEQCGGPERIAELGGTNG